MNWFIIFFVLIAITLYLLTKYNYLKKQVDKENIENFESELKLTPIQKLARYHTITLEFLTVNQAKKLLDINSDYFKNMNQPNLVARGVKTVDELYNKYLGAFDSITEDEQQRVATFILDLLDDVKPRNEALYRYIARWLNAASFAKAKSWLEGGMPHTLKQTIIMDPDWFRHPRRSTFIHEMTHVHQRAHPFEFEDIYDQLGYIYYPHEIKGLEYVYQLNRNNPDGLSKNWLWNNKVNGTYWWIGAIFRSIEPDSLTNVNMVALKLEKGADGTFYYLKQTPTPLSKLEGFDKLFGANPNNYHPNEMGAKFGEWFLEDTLGKGNQHYGYAGYLIYKKYFQNVLDKYY